MSELNFNAEDIEGSKEAMGLNPDELDILREWRPASMGVNSSFLGRIIETDKDVLAHASACMQWEKEQTKNLKEEKSSSYEMYLAECRLRKENVRIAKSNWKDAIEKRKAIIIEWSLYVDRMRNEYLNLKGSAPPVLPRK